jgi:hypothetical protein
VSQPFRWDVRRREQLGHLVDGQPLELGAFFLDSLLHGCSRVVALCDNADLLFVGRSPENYFDHLSGLLHGTSWEDRPAILNVSLRRPTAAGRPVVSGRALAAFRTQLASIGLAPVRIATRARPIALVDFVATGSTFGQLVGQLLAWARETLTDETAVKRQLRFIGMTQKTKTSPKTWRWHQHAAWTRAFRPSVIKNVSVSPRLANYLANLQIKTAPPNPPWKWGCEELARPPRWVGRIWALGLAYQLYALGATPARRLEFARALSREPAMEYRWFRGLVTELRGGRVGRRE